MASDVLDDQLSDLDVGGMGHVVDVEKSSVATDNNQETVQVIRIRGAV
jgi:hypothetical protein